MSFDNKIQNTVNGLFTRVVSILENARANIVQSVNYSTVIANWLIGREIVMGLQAGEERAEYGKRVIEALSEQLNSRFGKGFSTTNLWYFRQFYQAYSDRIEILHPKDGESNTDLQKNGFAPARSGGFQILHPMGGESEDIIYKNAYSFSPHLSWSHYRALMRVKDKKAREFYEKEAAESGWDKRDLERQIQSQYYERILSSQNPQALIEAGHRQLTGRGPRNYW